MSELILNILAILVSHVKQKNYLVNPQNHGNDKVLPFKSIKF